MSLWKAYIEDTIFSFRKHKELAEKAFKQVEDQDFFKKIVPVLKVSDMQRAVEFYTGVLGFTACWGAANDGGGENCMLQAGATSILLSTGSHLGDKPQFTGTLYFHMDGVKEFFDRTKSKVEIVWPLETMDYGQTFAEALEGK